MIWLLACFQPPSGGSPEDSARYDGATTLDWVEHDCDADEDTWSFTVRTVGWTSGGLLSLSADGVLVEAHDVDSAAAAPDGSWDSLKLDLDIVGDPRDAKAGTSTVWLCDAATQRDMAYRVVVYDPVTGDKADCATWGADLDWNAVAGYSACDPL